MLASSISMALLYTSKDGQNTGMTLDLRSRARGALLGLAAGDALGTTVEFSFGPQHLTDIVGGGP